MGAENFVGFVALCPFGLPADAQAADVVSTTVAHKHVVEVAQADGTVELVFLT